MLLPCGGHPQLSIHSAAASMSDLLSISLATMPIISGCPRLPARRQENELISQRSQTLQAAAHAKLQNCLRNGHRQGRKTAGSLLTNVHDMACMSSKELLERAAT